MLSVTSNGYTFNCEIPTRPDITCFTYRFDGGGYLGLDVMNDGIHCLALMNEDTPDEYNCSLGPVPVGSSLEASLQEAADELIGFLIDEGKLTAKAPSS
jgi:hypothetical protein